jgi:prepilin-type N-terminal cleavage/methylation domain-containing protein
MLSTAPSSAVFIPPARPHLRRGGSRSRIRRGMTLVEVILAIVILSGTMLGLGNFARKFQNANAGSTSKTLASDLAAQRIAEVQAYRPYSSIVSSYHSTSESWTAGVYKGFTRATSAVRCSGCPTATSDYITVTVSVTGNDLTTAVKKTVVIAAF